MESTDLSVLEKNIEKEVIYLNKNQLKLLVTIPPGSDTTFGNISHRLKY